MCSDPVGATGKVNSECVACGEPTVDGEAVEVCYYSSVECDTCGRAPCDGAC